MGSKCVGGLEVAQSAFGKKRGNWIEEKGKNTGSFGEGQPVNTRFWGSTVKHGLIREKKKKWALLESERQRGERGCSMGVCFRTVGAGGS